MRRGGCRLAATVAGGVALDWKLAFPWTWVHRSWEVGVCTSLGIKEGCASRGLPSSLEDAPLGPEVKEGSCGHLPCPRTPAQGKGKELR